MSAQLIPFNSDKLPAHIGKKKPTKISALRAGVSIGFGRISTEDSKWAIVRGETREVQKTKDGTAFLTAIPVVILKGSEHLTRVYYEKGWEKGKVEAPDCSSVDGVKPDTNAKAPQAKSCAACKWSAFGSAEQGNGPRCRNYRRLVVAKWPNIEEPLMLQVPGASLKALAKYAADLERRGIDYDQVVTKLGFDEEDSKKLTFEPAALLPDEIYAQVQEIAESAEVEMILGVTGTQVAESETPALPHATLDDDDLEAIETVKSAAKKEEVVDLEEVREKKTKSKKAEPVIEEVIEEPKPTKQASKKDDDLDDLLDSYDD